MGEARSEFGLPTGYRHEDDLSLLDDPVEVTPEDRLRRALGDILAWNNRSLALPARMRESAEAALQAAHFGVTGDTDGG